MIIDIPVVQTDTEASVVTAEADRDPPHLAQRRLKWNPCSIHPLPVTTSLLMLPSVFRSKTELTVSNVRGDSVVSLCSKLH